MAKILQLACGGRPKSSVIWDYFEYSIEKKSCECIVDVESNGKRKRCGILLSGKNTTNLKNHLKAHHAKEFGEFVKKDQELASTAATVLTKTNPPGLAVSDGLCQKITEAFKQQATWATSSAQHKKHLRLLSRAFITSGVSTLMADNEEFRAFCKSLEPKFALPSMCLLCL